jgi:predicted acetyltransferase
MKFVAAGRPDYRRSYLDALAEGYRLGSRKEMSETALAAARTDEAAFFRGVASPSALISLPNGEEVRRPPTTVLWWVDERSFIGELYLQHVLDSAMAAAYGGHIVYGVRPSRQGEGEAKLMLKAALPIAAAHGIARALLCVRSENIASRRVIEANGGLFMDEVPITYDKAAGMLRRYIVPTVR